NCLSFSRKELMISLFDRLSLIDTETVMFFCGMKMCLCCFISNSLFVKVLVTAEDFKCPTFIVSNDSILSRFVLGFLSSFGFGFLTFLDCLNLSFNSCPLVRFDTDRGLILYFSATWCKLILVRS